MSPWGHPKIAQGFNPGFGVIRCRVGSKRSVAHQFLQKNRGMGHAVRPIDILSAPLIGVARARPLSALVLAGWGANSGSCLNQDIQDSRMKRLAAGQDKNLLSIQNILPSWPS